MVSSSSECDLEQDILQQEFDRVNLEIDYIQAKIGELNDKLHWKFIRRQDILGQMGQR